MAPDEYYLNETETDCCRRVSKRRQLSLSTIKMAVLRGHRRSGRRASDHAGYYVDRVDGTLLYVALGILMLSGMDAMYTLQLMQLGAVEVNPFMAMLMEIDVGLFATVKMATTLIGLVVLLAHIKFRLFKVLTVKVVLYGILSTYLFLVAYELTLLATYG